MWSRSEFIEAADLDLVAGGAPTAQRRYMFIIINPYQPAPMLIDAPSANALSASLHATLCACIGNDCSFVICLSITICHTTKEARARARASPWAPVHVHVARLGCFVLLPAHQQSLSHALQANRCPSAHLAGEPLPVLRVHALLFHARGIEDRRPSTSATAPPRGGAARASTATRAASRCAAARPAFVACAPTKGATPAARQLLARSSATSNNECVSYASSSSQTPLGVLLPC